MSAASPDWEIGADQTGAPALVLRPITGRGGPDPVTASFIPLPAGLDPERALVIPRLARALWLWESAALELGECAIVTSGAADAGLVCLVAGWRTARAPVYLDLGGPAGSIEGATVIRAEEPDRAIAALAACVGITPGTAAVVQHGSVRAVDLLLEVLPTWGRILIATPAMEPAAVDFYNHVHRKGARLLGVPATPRCIFDPALHAATGPHVERAIRILRHDALATGCLKRAQ